MNIKMDKLEELLSLLKKKKMRSRRIQSSGYWRSSAQLQQLQESHLQYIVSSLRITWKISEEDFDDDYDDYFEDEEK